MKKRYIFLFALLCSGLNSLLMSETITLDLSNPTNPTEFVLDEDKGYWIETYNSEEKFRQIEFGLFSLTHTPTGFGGNDVGGGMSYWDGFTYCTSGDTNDYGVAGSSDGWVANQWGCMAGGGIKTDEQGSVLTGNEGKIKTEKGIPYMVAYWGYWVETVENGDPCLQVNFTDNNLYEAVGVYICNHPWPYYGNIHGDGFASAFDEEGDYFKLIIHGFNDRKEDIGITVEYMLAEFKDGELHQSPDWQWIDLSPLGEISGIYFTMESSDVHSIVELGPNTAVYFCMDKLEVKSMALSTKPSRPSGLRGMPAETTIHFTWNPSTSTNGTKGYNLYINGSEGIFTEDTNYTFTNLNPYTEYKIEVEAIAMDETTSSKASVVLQTTDDTPPSKPQNLQAITTANNISLTWDASTDNVGATEYHIYLDGERQKRVYETTYTLTGLDPETTYSLEVEARDRAGNRSERAIISVATKDIESGIPVVYNMPVIYYDASCNTINVKVIKNSRIEIYDMRGVLALSRNLQSGNNSIQIESLSQGIYILKCNNSILKIKK